MSTESSAEPEYVNIRYRVRSHQARSARLAELLAPQDWQAELRAAIHREQRRPPLLVSGSDAKLFAQSFTVFFLALMLFLA